MNNYTEEELKVHMAARQSGKTKQAKEKKMKIWTDKGTIQQSAINSYFARPRKDSPRRWLMRISKPKKFRFQSLLRGAMADSVKSFFSSPKHKNELRRIRQGRKRSESELKRAEVRTK